MGSGDRGIRGSEDQAAGSLSPDSSSWIRGRVSGEARRSRLGLLSHSEEFTNTRPISCIYRFSTSRGPPGPLGQIKEQKVGVFLGVEL